MTIVRIKAVPADRVYGRPVLGRAPRPQLCRLPDAGGHGLGWAGLCCLRRDLHRCVAHVVVAGRRRAADEDRYVRRRTGHHRRARDYRAGAEGPLGWRACSAPIASALLERLHLISSRRFISSSAPRRGARGATTALLSPAPAPDLVRSFPSIRWAFCDSLRRVVVGIDGV